MRILFVTHGIPLPPCGGHLLRAHHQMRLLAKQHEVDLIALADPGRRNTSGHFDLESYKSDLKQFCTEVELVPAPQTNRFSKIVKYLSFYPSTTTQIINSGLSGVVHEKLSRTTYDAVIFLLADVGICLPKTYSGFSILDMVDVFSVSFNYYSQSATSAFERLRRKLDALRYTYFERWVSARFDKVLVVAQADTIQYSKITDRFKSKIDWVPHGISAAEFARPEYLFPDSNNILITGDLSHPANVEGAIFFCREVLPLVIQQLPDAKVTIVGSRPKASIMELASDRVNIFSNVPDMKPYLYGAKVSFCGVKLRMGTQTKILEAMASGVPVVSTTAGNNGIEGINGTHLFVSDDPATLAQSVSRLCTDEALWKTIARNANEYVLNKFNWENSVERLTQIIKTHDP